jgi:hypothetical protein
MEHGFTRPVDRPNYIYVINRKTGTGSWEPLFDDEGKPTLPTLIGEPDKIKAKRPTGGLMLRRDGTGRPWVGSSVERKCQETIDAAGLHPLMDSNGEPHTRRSRTRLPLKSKYFLAPCAR